jgi:peroxiredoxin
MKTFLAIAAVSTLLGLSLYAADAGSLRPAPELAFTLPGKGPAQLSQYKGKVVALAFVSTTCPHCQAKSKELTKLQEELGPRGLQVIGVATNPNADLLVDNFVKDFKVGFPVGYMPGEHVVTFMNFSPTDRWVVPQLALIDRKGIIHYQTTATETDAWDKLMEPAALRAHIEELLNMGSGSTSSTARKKSVAVVHPPAQ